MRAFCVALSSATTFAVRVSVSPFSRVFVAVDRAVVVARVVCWFCSPLWISCAVSRCAAMLSADGKRCHLMSVCVRLPSSPALLVLCLVLRREPLREQTSQLIA